MACACRGGRTAPALAPEPGKPAKWSRRLGRVLRLGQAGVRAPEARGNAARLIGRNVGVLCLLLLVLLWPVPNGEGPAALSWRALMRLGRAWRLGSGVLRRLQRLMSVLCSAQATGFLCVALCAC